MAAVDPRTPCIIGVGQRTWHPADVGEPGAPEPLVMWEEVARLAADDTGLGASALEQLDSLDIVYCQTWQYDDACGAPVERDRQLAPARVLLGHRRHDAAGARERRRGTHPAR